VLRYKVASLFCGGGGFDLGFQGGFSHLGVKYERLPFDIVWANDNDPDARDVYTANQKRYLGKHDFTFGDIEGVDLDSVPDFDILTAGFPCQPFSNAGNRKGVLDSRGTLFEEVERFVKSKQPKAFILENVKGILSTKMPDGTTVPAEIIRRLSSVKLEDGSSIKYTISGPKLVKAQDYGVPQQRHRVLIIGIREDIAGPFQFNFDNILTYVKEESLQKVTVRHVVEGIKDELPNAQDFWKFSPQAAKLVPLVKRSWKDIPYDSLPPRLKRIRDDMVKYRSPNFYRRFALDEINGTITASAQPENCGILHPIHNRRYTVREIARIQSFPDDFVFTCKSIQNMYKVIGNAVPPVLIHSLAKALKDHLSIASHTEKQSSQAIV
jgi:DNA (cytosine-5)-methyltransferase 1